MGKVNLEEQYREMADKCHDAGVAIDAEPGGAIHKWIVQNVKFREGTEFFIVNGIAAAMSDIEAKTEGFTDQLDRAANNIAQIKLPKKGDEPVRIEGPMGEVALLKKCSDGRQWHLKQEGVNDHSRFGNAAHIRQDIEHFKMHGSLPRGERW